jgi:hypothetical protein
LFTIRVGSLNASEVCSAEPLREGEEIQIGEALAKLPPKAVPQRVTADLSGPIAAQRYKHPPVPVRSTEPSGTNVRWFGGSSPAARAASQALDVAVVLSIRPAEVAGAHGLLSLRVDFRDRAAAVDQRETRLDARAALLADPVEWSVPDQLVAAHAAR